MNPIAAIDIGTNSIHLLVATIDAKNRLNEIVSTKEMVRLGAKSEGMSMLSKNAIRRAIVALAKFKKVAAQEKAQIIATATSAVREASNGADFVEMVKNECGIDVNVIDGLTEARLIYRGVTGYYPIFDSNILVVDIGGGSTETIVGNSGNLLFAESVKLGTIRLKEMFFPGKKYSEKNKKKCRQKIHQTLEFVFEEIKKYELRYIVGTSGTIRAITRIGLIFRNNDNDVLYSNRIPISYIKTAIGEIVKCKTENEISSIREMDKSRSDIILSGALILDYAIQRTNLEYMLVSPYALREGIVYEFFHKSINSFS